MNLKKLAIITAIIGLGIVFAGLYIYTLDSGSCPAEEPGCSHTFAGSDVHIRPVANLSMKIGAVVLGGALIVGLIGRSHKAG